MPGIFNTKYSRDQLLRRLGNISQAGGTRLFEYQDGTARGVRAIEFDTATGFRFTVLVDRAMDIFAASYRGCSLCWHSPAGVPAPSYYEPEGRQWVRNFPGGLVTTCGLTQAGGACEDNGEVLGLHGRISNTPASNVTHGTRWDGDECVLYAQGVVTEASLFAPQLTMTRTITTRLGENRLFIRDVVENIGYEPAPHMLLYHCNIGFPVLDEGSRLILPSKAAAALNDDTQDDPEWQVFTGPTPNYRERVYDHALQPGPDGIVTAAIINEGFDNGAGLGVYLRYRLDHLPRFTEWKMLGEGSYVVGMEPGNCSVLGRAAAREAGELVFLQPGETRTYDLEVGLLYGDLNRVASQD